MAADRTVLLATDADWLATEVDASLADEHTEVLRVRSGAEVVDAIVAHQPDLVILDLQIGNMGGMATCMAVRLEEGAGRLDPVAVLMLLDREQDAFLARRSAADGWVVKPLDPFRLRKAARAVMAGEDWEESETAPTVPAQPV